MRTVAHHHQLIHKASRAVTQSPTMRPLGPEPLQLKTASAMPRGMEPRGGEVSVGPSDRPACMALPAVKLLAPGGGGVQQGHGSGAGEAQDGRGGELTVSEAEPQVARGA